MPNRSFQYGKGQMSLEFLLIFAIFLSVLSVFLASLSKVKSDTEASLDQILLNRLGNDLVYSINSICILGDGNKREIESAFISGTAMSCAGNKFSVSLKNSTLYYELNCDAVCDYNGGDKIKLENRNGTVHVS